MGRSSQPRGVGRGSWTGLSADLGFSGLAACEGPPHSWNRCEALPQDAPQVHTCEAFRWWRVLALNRSPPGWPFHARPFHLRLCLPSLSPRWAAGTSGANPGTQGQGTGRSSDPQWPPSQLPSRYPLTCAGLPSPGALAWGHQGREHHTQHQQDRHEGSGSQAPSSGSALGPRGGSCSLDRWASPPGDSHCDGHMPESRDRDRAGRLLRALSGAGQLVPAGRSLAHPRTGSGPAAQVTGDSNPTPRR